MPVRVCHRVRCLSDFGQRSVPTLPSSVHAGRPGHSASSAARRAACRLSDGRRLFSDRSQLRQFRPALQAHHHRRHRCSSTLKVPCFTAADAATHHSGSPAACSGLPREERSRGLGAEEILRLRSGPCPKSPILLPHHGTSGALAAPQLGSCASSGRAWRLWAVCTPGSRGPPTERPASPSGARAGRRQSRRFHGL